MNRMCGNCKHYKTKGKPYPCQHPLQPDQMLRLEARSSDPTKEQFVSKGWEPIEKENN